MPAYIYVPGISGTATARGYEKWIEIDSFIALGLSARTELGQMPYHLFQMLQTLCLGETSSIFIQIAKSIPAIPLMVVSLFLIQISVSILLQV